tara:strand:+ start:5570 stop:6037 length:468 start_codon:yes stop_codon:yes gene_type:complete
MAFGAGTTIESFSGWVELTDGSNSAVAADAISVLADMAGGTGWTNSEDAESAGFMLYLPTMTAPVVNETVSLWARQMDMNTVNDAQQPGTTYIGHRVGSWGLQAVTTQYAVLSNARLPNMQTAQKFEFYIINHSSQSIAANWQLWINTKGHIASP